MIASGRLVFFAHSLAACQFCCRGLFHGKRSRFNCSSTFVCRDDDSARRRLRFPQCEGCLSGAVGKQALSQAKRERKNFQPQLINQIMPEKGLNEVATAMNLQFGPVLLLSQRSSRRRCCYCQWCCPPGRSPRWWYCEKPVLLLPRAETPSAVLPRPVVLSEGESSCRGAPLSSAAW